jgi:hypothetical protein
VSLLILNLKLLADVMQALVHFIFTGTNVLNEPDDEPDSPDDDQGGDDGSKDGESRHEVFSLENGNRGAIEYRSPIQGMF